MKVKTKLLDSIQKSLERLYQIRKLIRGDKMNELSDEIKEFYKKNKTIIKKWKAVFDFNSNMNPFPIKKEKKFPFAIPVFKEEFNEGESVWRCLVDTTIDPHSDSYHYLDIIISYNNKHLEVELYEWFHFPEDMHEENFNEVIFSCFFNKGLNKLDLDNVTNLLFAFVYMGGELGSLEKLDNTENITTL